MLIRNVTYFDGNRIARGDLERGESDEEFDATLDEAVGSIFAASRT